MDRLESQSQQINESSYSSILNSAKHPQVSHIPSSVTQSPFQMITTEENQFEAAKHSQKNLESYKGLSYKHFAKEDLHRNPLAESVQGGIEMRDSQEFCKPKLHNDQRESYLTQYQVEEETQKQEIFPFKSNHEEQKHFEFKNVFTSDNTSLIPSHQNLQHEVMTYVQNTQTQPNYYVLNQNFSKQKIIPNSPPPSQTITSSLMPSYDHNISQSHSANEQISEVKYRLDQLMKRFPINQQKSERGHQEWRKNQMNMFETSAPQLYIKRSVSMEGENHANPVLLNFTSQQEVNQVMETVRPSPHTEMKIPLPFSSQYDKTSHIPSYSYQKYHPESLNYSSSIQKGSIEYQAKANMQALYQQIHQQQQAITTYKNIIYRLENDNLKLSSLVIELNKKQQQQSIRQNQNKSLQNIYSCSPNDHNILWQKQINQSEKLSSQLVNSLESRIHTLQLEKSQLSKKITWLNNVIKELLLTKCINDDKKNQQTSEQSQQNSFVKVATKRSSFHHLTPPFQHSNKHLHAELESIPVQTSFIDPITQNFDQFNYKRLYEKEIQYQQRMKQEMHELEMLQYAYDEQFRKVLQQIEEIKKNRSYYQSLKREIKKEKSRSKSKGLNYEKERSNSRNINIKFKSNQQTPGTSRVHYQFGQKPLHLQTTYLPLPKSNILQVNTSTQSSPMLSRIFENQIIYQLKTQNEILKANLQKVATQFIGNQNQQSRHQNQRSHFASDPNFTRTLLKNTVTHSAVLNETKNFNNFTKMEKPELIKINERPNSKMTIVEKLKKRPHSISQLSILQDKKNSPNKSSLNKSRRNGSISYISSNELNYNKNNIPKQFQKNTPLSASKYKNNLLSAETIKNNSYYQILEQKSSNFTQQQNQQAIVNRYNNFIKNMKKKFGINSQIIGKEIVKGNIKLSTNKFDQK